MTHDIFISYSSQDKPIADGICANLEAAGIRCWIAPRDIAPGEDWPAAIATAISQSRVMVLVFSAHSNKSEEVSRELYLAANNRVIIIPFKIEDVKPEAGKQYYLGRTHWLDAMNPPTREQIHMLVQRAKACLTVGEGTDGGQPTPIAGPPGELSGTQPAAPRSRSWWPLLLIPLALIILLGAWQLLGLGKGSALPVPTATPSPTASLPPMASVTPALLPTETRTAVPTPPGGILFAADFSDPAYDGAFDTNQWAFPSYYRFYTVIKQENGAVVFSRLPADGEEDGQIQTKASWSVGEFSYVEAKFKVSGEHEGNGGNLNIAMALPSNSPDIWYTTCGISLDDPRPYLWCIQVSSGQPPYDYDRTLRSMEYDRWYTVRIEMDPQTAELSFYVDGQLLDRWQPDDVEWLMQQKLILITGASAAKGTGMTGYVDDVKIGR